MGGWIIISDVEYKLTKQGERYGWGVARYSTPEIVFGEINDTLGRNYKESLNYIVKTMTQRWRWGNKKSFEILLK